MDLSKEYIVNLQGDEPMITPESIDGVISALHNNKNADIATLLREIKDPEEANGDEEIEALKARIEELEEENAALKTNARTVEDNKILNAVKMAGGENWLAKHCSTYRVSLRTQSFKNTVETQASAEETPIQRKLREEREKRTKK